MADRSIGWVEKQVYQDDSPCAANRVADVRRFVRAVQRDESMLDLLAEQGFGQDRLAEGLRLYRTAQAALVARQAALARWKHASAHFDAVEAEARQVYGDFRSVARLIFTSGVARIDLSLEGKTPEDVEKFLIVARCTLETASHNTLYRRQLLQYGSLEGVRQAIVELEAAYQDLEAARESILSATQKWDRVMVSLERWINRFCKTARAALQYRPDLREKLGF